MKNSLTAVRVAALLMPFRVLLTQEQCEAVRAYVDMLLRWNRAISLTALESPEEIVTRHFGESIFAGTFLQFQLGRLADVGTGAGFPGMALKVAFPSLDVVLIEPNQKKCAFLSEIKRELRLENVEIVRSRFEDCQLPEPFDYICSRALGAHKNFLRSARSALKPAGKVVMWLGSEDANLLTRETSWIWDVPVRIPESRKRLILCGAPTSRRE